MREAWIVRVTTDGIVMGWLGVRLGAGWVTGIAENMAGRS